MRCVVVVLVVVVCIVMIATATETPASFYSTQTPSDWNRGRLGWLGPRLHLLGPSLLHRSNNENCLSLLSPLPPIYRHTHLAFLRPFRPLWRLCPRPFPVCLWPTCAEEPFFEDHSSTRKYEGKGVRKKSGLKDRWALVRESFTWTYEGKSFREKNGLRREVGFGSGLWWGCH